MDPDTPVIKFVSPTTQTEIVVPLPPEPLRGPLFKLPRELRDQIYRHVLIEPPLWEKTHTPFCKFSPLDLDVLAPPPLVTFTYNPWPREVIKQYCPCARRRGLGLLQTCRTIDAEASQIFWSENTFLFHTGGMFLTNVVGTLREENRRRIAHLAVVRALFQHSSEWDTPTSSLELEQGRGNPQIGPARRRRYDEFWEGILGCTGLRTLYVQVDFAQHGKHHMAALPSRLPHLNSLRIAFINYQHFHAPPRAASPPGREERSLVRDSVVCWFTYPVPLGTDEETSRRRTELPEILRPFTDMPLPIESAIQAWSHWKYSTEPFDPSHFTPLPVHPEALVKNAAFRAPLAEGIVVRVLVLGLPMNREQRAKSLRRRAVHERLRAAGLPRLLEARIVEEFEDEEKAARAAATPRQGKEGERDNAERETLDERAVMLEERRKRNKLNAMNAEKKEKKARRRGIKEAQATRKAERKRV